MNSRTLLGKKMPMALAAAGLLFGLTAVPVNAAQNSAASAAAISSQKFSRHLVLHGIRFDNRTGQLDPGSKAVLDNAAQFLKSNPATIVFVDNGNAGDSNHACGLSSAEANTIASYMRERGVPDGRIMLCQGNGSFRVAEER